MVQKDIPQKAIEAYNMRSKRMIISFLVICCVFLIGCGSTFRPVSAVVIDEDQFGDVMLDLKGIDLEYGDSVNISFSGGYDIKGIPYYPDFYGSRGSAILTDYFDSVCVAGIGCSFNSLAGIENGESVVISLEQKSRYKDELEAYDISNAKVRSDGQSDEEYRNAREIKAGQIKDGRLYRGPSPFDQDYGRVELMDRYIQDNNISCVLDLSDTQERLEGFEDLPEHTASLVSADHVIACAIGVDYLNAEAMDTIGCGLAEMAESDGPYLIHCSLGRDRTGVVCAVIEALCEATYEEIIEDYMASYDMLHGIDMDPGSLQYKLFKQRIDEQLEAILGIGIDQLPTSNLQKPAAGYLVRCGMTGEQVEMLIDRLT